MRKTIYNNIKALRAMPIALRATNTTVNGDTIDLASSGANYRTVMFVISTGTVTDGSYAFVVQDSDDGTAWGTAAASLLTGSAPTVVAANDDVIFEVGIQPVKRYVRVSETSTAVTTGATFGAVALLGQPSLVPVTR
ncbi:MAG: hypothetical protein ACREYC_22235 [Gammaproteobacteria bacterium]